MTTARNRRDTPSSGKRPTRMLLAAAVLLSFLAPATTQAGDFSDSGFYVGVSGVYTHNFFDEHVDQAISDAVGGDVDVSIDDSAGLNARVGYRALSWFAIEAQYEWVKDFDVKAKIDALALSKQRIFSIEGHTITANTRFIVPIWRTQPYVLLGAGYALYDSDVRSIVKPIIGSGGKERGFAGRLGGGLDLYVTEHIVLNTEATALLTTQDFSTPDTGNIDDLWYMSLSAGLRYQF